MASSNSRGPSYYRRGAVQPWEFVRDQELNFHLGNAIKYICRAGHKDSKIDDLTKAIHYLQNELEYTIKTQVPKHSEKSPGEFDYQESFISDFDR